MMHALNLDKNKRVQSTTWDKYAPAEYPRVETLPDGDVRDYLYVDGEFVYDPLPDDPESEPEATTDEVLDVLLGIGGAV